MIVAFERFQLDFLPIAGSVCFVALNIPWTMSSLMTRLSGPRGLAMSVVVGRRTFAGACAFEGGGARRTTERRLSQGRLQLNSHLLGGRQPGF